MDTPATDAAPASRASLQLTALLALAVAAVAVLFAAKSSYAGGWYALFKTVHVIFAVVWVGGGTILTLLGLVAERRRDAAEIATIARQAAFVGERVFAPAGLIVFAMGIAMMLNTNWGWGEFWIVAGLVGYASTFVTGTVVLTPLAKSVAALTEEHGAEHPATLAAIQRILLVVRFDIAVLLLVIADMVTKPFA
jgi:uncharacterized membrane protein